MDNSDDDNEDSNLSCITDVSVSVDDEDMAIYRESLTSQASAMGFGTPLAHSTIFTLEQVVTHCKYLKATAEEG
jgi:hypothetical protein